MTPEQLKASILQYAIQGKLVEQRPEEGTGEELYQQIQAEKKRLIKEGKIKKDKPLPEIAEDEIPFDIPESWRWVRFSEIMSTMSTGPFGSMLHKTDYIEKGIPLVNPANMVNGKIVPSDKMMISEATRRRLSSYILHAGMIVLGRRGEMGRCAVVTEKEDGWLCGTGSFFMEPSMSLYVYYVVSLFSSPYVKFYLGGESVGTTMSNLNHTILSKMPIPLPPLAEQRRIVAKIEELLPYVDRYATAYEKLEQFNAKFPNDMKKSILEYAIQGKLVEQRAEEGTGEELYRQIQAEKQQLIKEGKIKKEKLLPEIVEDEIPFDIPESWKWVRLLDVVEEKPANGFSPKGVDYQTAVKNLTLTATTSGYFKSDAFKYVDIQLEPDSKYWLKKDDLLIQRSNSRELVGTSCIYTGDDDAFIYPDLMMKLRVMNGVDVKYVDHVLKSPLTRNYFSKTASGTSESMPKINQGIVSATLIPLPPLAEQKRIVAKLEEILPLCERLK